MPSDIRNPTAKAPQKQLKPRKSPSMAHFGLVDESKRRSKGHARISGLGLVSRTTAPLPLWRRPRW